MKIGGRSGGILMFDTELKPEQWGVASINPYLLGCYSVNPETLYTRKVEGNVSTYEHPESSLYEVIIQPPLNQEYEFFYGPRRFIALKPDELVIADDGAYIEGDQEPDALKISKKRVVSVNLENKSLSIIDVDVSYSSEIVSGSSGTYVDD